ncbi:MAG: hypothetical protein IT307_17470, partial [Chloroflexi bacterium]|nr:hypothetical protein [Chloroflexota bacterium]
YGEQIAIRNFPEAQDRFGPIFFLPPPALGEESQVVASCIEEGCSGIAYFIHHRIVFRTQNVVAMLYTWGEQSSSQLADVVTIARNVSNRMVP